MVKIFIPANYYLNVENLGEELRSSSIAVSLTGDHCMLRCKHCNARILENMVQATTPEKLLEIATELRNRGINSILVSGGSNVKGQVPFEEFVEALKHVKNMGFRIYMHTGLVDEYRAQLLREAKIDVALIDFTVNEVVIKDVFNLNASSSDFINSVKNLVKFSVRVVPHVVIGIYCGKPSGEKQAIDILSRLNPDAVTLVVFVPLPGTLYEHCKPPQPGYVSEILKYARTNLHHIPLSYGCMKPRGSNYYFTEIEAIRLGFEGLASPSYSTVEYLLKNKIPLEILRECCAYTVLQRS